MPTGSKPIVYISYRWLTAFGEDPRSPIAKPDPRARELADELRAEGLDVRFDLYFRDSEHGFAPPRLAEGNPQQPWLTWAAQHIAEADVVLMYCTPEYAKADLVGGARQGPWWNWSQLDEETRIQEQERVHVPALWWDWLAIAGEYPRRPQKFIPIGVGSYRDDLIPAFARGATYLNLSDDGAFDTLLRRVRQMWRERVPRSGVFISYAHKDDPSWLDNLLSHLSWLKSQYNIDLWTDRDIEPGDKWHETIQAALDRAKVAVLLVTQNYLASDYITSNELPKMLEAAEIDGMEIFWIPVRSSTYEHSPLAKLQAARAANRPLADLRAAARDRAFVEISEKLGNVLGVTAN